MAGDQFLWIGPLASDWDTASNWEDLTTGADPALVAPGSLDSVTFNSPTSEFQVIEGQGNAASVTFTGDNAIGGTLTVGTLSQPSGMLEVLSGATLQATSGTFGGESGDGLSVSGSNAVALFGTLDINVFDGGLAVANGGFVQAGSLVLGNVNSYITLDATSTVEVGEAGGAAAGVLTIDAGSTLTNVGTFNDFIEVGVVDNGVLEATALNIDGDLSGTGSVQIVQGGSLSVNAILGNLTISLANSADLSVGPTTAGSSIVLSGTGDVVNLPGAPGTTTAGAISGFDDTDAINIFGTVTSATDTGAGLILQDGGSTVGTLDLVGNYSGDSFLTVPVTLSVGGSPLTVPATEIVLYNASVTAAGGTITVSPVARDTVSLNQLLTDPSIAPGGTIDTLIIDGPGTVEVSGDVTINTLDVSGGGTFVLNGATVVTDPVTVDAGGGLSGSGQITGALTDQGSITAAGGTLELTGAVSGAGTLAVADDATLKLDGSIAAGLAIDFQPSGSDETLVLGMPLGTGALIEDLAATDSITFAGSYSNVSRDFSGNVMTVTGDGATIAELTFTAGYDDADTSVSDSGGVVTIEGTVISTGQTFFLTKGVDHVHGGSGNNTVVAASGTLSPDDTIDGGVGGTNTLELTGPGPFDLRAPTTLTDIQIITAQEGQPAYSADGTTIAAQNQIATLRDGLNATVNVSSATLNPDNPRAATITVVGATNTDVINLGSGNDIVTMGVGETVHGGTGNDTIIVNAATIGDTIDGGTGDSTLEVTGGGNLVMGGNISNIAEVLLTSSPTKMSFIADALSGLAVDDTNTGANTIQAGGLDQTISGGHGSDTFVGFGGGSTTFLDTGALINGDTIANFLAPNDLIDITDFKFSGNPSLTFVENGSNTAGVLTITDGSQKAAITLDGLFSQPNFHLAADTSGTGTAITYHAGGPV